MSNISISNKSFQEDRGLSDLQVEKLLKEFGPNTIEDKKTSVFAKILHWLISPMSILLLLASLLSFYIGKTFDGWFILVLFVINFGIAQWHEMKADKAIETLQKKLTISVEVKRNNKWQNIASNQLVPGDLVQLGVGNIIPADITILFQKNLSVNESALTGESLPVDKKDGESVFSGSYISTGEMVGKVLNTAMRTKFGKTLTLVSNKPKKSTLDKDVLTITKFLTIVSLMSAVVISVYLIFKHQNIPTLLTLDLSLLIAGTPVAMPTVMSLIISLGVVRLTKKHVIVRRISSLEDLANVNMLLSDKTGTLTKNEIVVEDIKAYGNNSLAKIVELALSATKSDAPDPINQAIVARALSDNVKAFEQKDFTPADSKRKRSTAQVLINNIIYTISMGAPQIIESLCSLNKETHSKFLKDIESSAALGYRSLAISLKKGDQEKNMDLVGILLLSDSLRPDSSKVIEFLNNNGIGVKMMTGDNRAIASRVATKLGMSDQVLIAAGKTASLSNESFNRSDVFAEVLPDDKYNIVKAAAKTYTVAATGDGVNDLPAIRQASRWNSRKECRRCS